MTGMGRVKIVYKGSTDRLAACYVVGPDGVEVQLPITGVQENSEAHHPGKTTIELHRMHVDHVREAG